MVRFDSREHPPPPRCCSVITVLVNFTFLEGKQSLSYAFSAAGEGNCDLNRKGHMHGGKQKSFRFYETPPPPTSYLTRKLFEGAYFCQSSYFTRE